MIDLYNKRFVITGLPGSGKTNLAKHFLSQTSQHLVYDPLRDYLGYNRYEPTDNYSKTELDQFIRKAVVQWKPRLFIIDEANKYIQPKPVPLPQAVAELNDWSRHYGITWGLLARRPTQMHTDVIELAHYVFTFQLRGKNDRKFFDSYSPGLGDIVADLDPWHFLVIESSGDIFIHNPVPLAPPVYEGLTAQPPTR